MLLEDVLKSYDQLLRERRFSEALAVCDEALASRLSPKIRCRFLQMKARALLSLDPAFELPAIGCLRDALALTKKNPELRARVLASLTAAWATRSSLSNCVEARDAFLEVMRANPGPTIEGLYAHVEYNVGVAHHMFDHFDAAESAYLLALKAIGTSKEPHLMSLKQLIYHNLIDVFQELERHEEAYSCMSQVIHSLDDAVYGAQIRNRKALYALHLGDIASAVLWAESGLGHESCDPPTRAALLLTRARIARAQGDLAEATASAEEALAVAKGAHNNWMRSRAQRFLTQLSEGV